MSIRRYTHGIQYLINFDSVSGIDPDVYLETAGTSAVYFHVQVQNPGGTSITGLKAELFGIYDASTVALYPIPVTDATGDATASGNTVTFPATDGWSSIRVVNPPPAVKLTFSATTFVAGDIVVHASWQ